MIDYSLLERHFKENGWAQYHIFMRGTRWEKDNHSVIRDAGGYMYDEKRVDENTIITMLKIDIKEIEMYERLKELGYGKKLRFAFLEGVKWANCHQVLEIK